MTTRPVRDDRVLPYTRRLSLFITPFLVVAFAVLYPFPGDTRQLFAWTIRPTMTPMVLASAYAGGAYFFVRVLREPRWAAVKTGFVAVMVFASLLGVATVIHWDRFNHRHVAFWLWAFLYLTAPFLVLAAWLSNRRHAALPTPRDRRLGRGARWVIGLVGLLAVAQGVFMFVAPATAIPMWPWTLTPLTCRVMAAVFCLGCAGLAVPLDPRWRTVRLLLQVEVLMVTLMLVAGVRARSQIDTERPLTWLLLGRFLGVLAGSAYLWLTYGRGERRA